MAFPKRYADFVARLRVPTGFLLVAAFAWFSNPSAGSLAAGLPLSAAGVGLRGWAAGHLSKNRRLATSGPYAHTRNPLYLGTLLVAAGLAIASGSISLAVLFAAVFLLVYLPVIELEEQHLRKIFPEYAGYAEGVPRLGLRWRCPASTEAFQFALYTYNREYQALAGFVAGAVLLAYKVWRKG